MMTNTFTPHVGGVARSFQSFTNGYRKRGHRVLVIALDYENMPEKEVDVIRIPAIQHFNRSDFSVVLPIPGILTSAVEKYRLHTLYYGLPLSAPGVQGEFFYGVKGAVSRLSATRSTIAIKSYDCSIPLQLPLLNTTFQLKVNRCLKAAVHIPTFIPVALRNHTFAPH
jgi:hypothetical protein